MKAYTNNLQALCIKTTNLAALFLLVLMPLYAQAADPDTTKSAPQPVQISSRDEIGDLNRDAIKAGDFPGSFMIPGPGRISLAIGGFVKVAAIGDFNAEVMGAAFLPATLGIRRSDHDGGFSIDATITRLHLDGRAPTKAGQIRGYVEWDFNNNNDGTVAFKARHAYGTWSTRNGTLTAGHTWSTMMDLKTLPEGLTEPTVSGAIFARQAIARWSQILSKQLTLHVAVEDPSSSDIFGDQPLLGKAAIPDAVMGFEYDHSGTWHLRMNSILRSIKVELPTGGNESEIAWGLTLSGHVNLFGRDRFRFSGTYGKGLGRYLLGILSIDGGAVNISSDELTLRDNWGAMASYEHHWTDDFRSTALAGYAYSKPLFWQAEGTLKNTIYAAANLMWQVLPYLNFGIEYAYGLRENNDGSYLDNYRVMAGVQVF